MWPIQQRHGTFKQFMRKLGDRWERYTENYLQQHGLTTLKQNFNGPRGEIDLIMQDDDQIVFIEVKYRTDTDFGEAFEAVTPDKQKRIIHTARCYLMQYPQYANETCRFDVVSITGHKPPQVLWLKAAFEAGWS